MFCSNCGNQINEGMAFCDKCGVSLTSQPPAPPLPADNPYAAPPPPPPPPPPPAQMGDNPYAATQQPRTDYAYTAPQISNPYAQTQYAEHERYPQQGYPGVPGANKPSKAPIVIACIIAGALILGGILLFAFRESIFGSGSRDIEQPAQAQAPAQAQGQYGGELEGTWVFERGVTLYHFEDAKEIIFTVNGDGTGTVLDDYGELAAWVIDDSGNTRILRIFGDVEYYGTREFTYTVNNNTLILVDEDGDTRTFSRTP